MKMKLLLLMLMSVMVCMGTLTAAAATCPAGVVFADEEAGGEGPAEFAGLLGVICGEEDPDEGPAE